MHSFSFSHVASFFFFFLEGKKRIGGTAKREQIKGVPYGRWE